MAPKLSSRQVAQLGWLETLPSKFDRMKRTIELIAVQQADEAQQRALARLLSELKAQAADAGIAPLAETFGYMGMLMRGRVGHQVRCRGLAELLVSAKTNFEGALREASTPESPDVEENAVNP